MKPVRASEPMQQDTKECLNQKRVPTSEISGSQKRGDKRGGEEGRSGEGERGGKKAGKRVGGKAPRSTLEKL